MIFNKEQVQEMLMQAFVKGEDWGSTYGGWFIPSKKEKAERAAKDCSEVYQKALNDKETISNLGVIENAINNYWHFVTKKLENKNLGDIERNNYEHEKKVIEKWVIK